MARPNEEAIRPYIATMSRASTTLATVLEQMLKAGMALEDAIGCLMDVVQAAVWANGYTLRQTSPTLIEDRDGACSCERCRAGSVH